MEEESEGEGMKVFDVDTVGWCIDVYSVVAEDMATAEKLFLKEHPTSTIRKITLHSDCVIVQVGGEK